MRRLLTAWISLALILALLCASAEVGDIAAYVAERGFAPEVSDSADGMLRCDLDVLGPDNAALAWTDGAHIYAISGDAHSIALMYVLLLDMAPWDACRACTNGGALMSYGADSAERFDTLEQYAAHMRVTLGVDPQSADAPQDVHTYVLNLRSHRFHRPDCPGIASMSAKNRRDYTGTREALIDLGYSPCGTCDP